MAARRPFWKWHRWKSIGFCLWPPSTCIWNLKLKFQSKLDLCSGNHVVYRQTDKVNPVYPPPTSLGGGIMMVCSLTHICVTRPQWVNSYFYSVSNAVDNSGAVCQTGGYDAQCLESAGVTNGLVMLYKCSKMFRIKHTVLTTRLVAISVGSYLQRLNEIRILTNYIHLFSVGSNYLFVP